MVRLEKRVVLLTKRVVLLTTPFEPEGSTVGGRPDDDNGPPVPGPELPAEPRPRSCGGCPGLVAGDNAAPDEPPGGAREEAAVAAAAAPPEAPSLPAREGSVSPRLAMRTRLDFVVVAVVVVLPPVSGRLTAWEPLMLASSSTPSASSPPRPPPRAVLVVFVVGLRPECDLVLVGSGAGGTGTELAGRPSDRNGRRDQREPYQRHEQRSRSLTPHRLGQGHRSLQSGWPCRPWQRKNQIPLCTGRETDENRSKGRNRYEEGENQRQERRVNTRPTC